MQSLLRIVLICSAFTGISVCIAKAGEDWKPSFELSVDLLSKYVGGPNNVLAYDKPVSQTNLWVGWKNGVYFNVWNSQILGKENPVGNFGNEIDWTLGWAGTMSGFGVDISVNYFDVSAPKLFEFRGDIVQIALEVNRKFVHEAHTITPYIRLEPSWITGGVAPFAAYFQAGVRHRWQVNDFLTIADSVRVAYDSGVYGATEGYNLRIDVAPVWKITDELDFRAPYVRYYVPLSDYLDGRKNQLVLGVGLDWRPKQ